MGNRAQLQNQENLQIIRDRSATYILLELIYNGKQNGNHHEIYKVVRHDKQNIFLACKKYEKSLITTHQTLKYIRDELNIINEIDHPNIIKLRSYCETEENMYVFTEYCQKQDLQSKMPFNSEQKSLHYLLQIIKGIQALHQKNITLKSLKPTKLFITQTDEVKIADLKNLKKIDESIQESYSLDVLMMAPEIYLGLDYDFSVDVWLIGFFFYYMLYNKYPFELHSKDDFKDIDQILQKINFKPPFKMNISPLSIDFIKQCLQYPQNKRRSFDEMATQITEVGGIIKIKIKQHLQEQQMKEINVSKIDNAEVINQSVLINIPFNKKAQIDNILISQYGIPNFSQNETSQLQTTTYPSFNYPQFQNQGAGISQLEDLQKQFSQQLQKDQKWLNVQIQDDNNQQQLPTNFNKDDFVLSPNMSLNDQKQQLQLSQNKEELEKQEVNIQKYEKKLMPIYLISHILIQILHHQDQQSQTSIEIPICSLILQYINFKLKEISQKIEQNVNYLELDQQDFSIFMNSPIYQKLKMKIQTMQTSSDLIEKQFQETYDKFMILKVQFQDQRDQVLMQNIQSLKIQPEINEQFITALFEKCLRRILVIFYYKIPIKKAREQKQLSILANLILNYLDKHNLWKKVRKLEKNQNVNFLIKEYSQMEYNQLMQQLAEIVKQES